MLDEDKNEKTNEEKSNDEIDYNGKDNLIRKKQLRTAISLLKIANLIWIIVLIIILASDNMGIWMIAFVASALGAGITAGNVLSEFVERVLLPIILFFIIRFLCNKSKKRLEEDSSKTILFYFCALIMHIVSIGMNVLILTANVIGKVFLVIDVIVCLISLTLATKNAKLYFHKDYKLE